MLSMKRWIMDAHLKGILRLTTLFYLVRSPSHVIVIWRRPYEVYPCKNWNFHLWVGIITLWCPTRKNFFLVPWKPTLKKGFSPKRFLPSTSTRKTVTLLGSRLVETRETKLWTTNFDLWNMRVKGRSMSYLSFTHFFLFLQFSTSSTNSWTNHYLRRN